MKSITVSDCFPTDWLDAFDPQYGRIGAGLDVATTTKRKSNPSAFALTQQVGLTYHVRLVIRLKTGDGDVLKALIETGQRGLLSRGLKMRRLCVDASNERFFAASLQKHFVGKLPVELVVSGSTHNYLGEDMTMKAYLGNLLVNTAEDGYLALPNETWLKDDLRQVYREKGSFAADVDENGAHADCFDGIKLSLHALKGTGGPVEAHAVDTGHGQLAHRQRAGLKNPLLKYQRRRGGLML